jgi:hypothetical protein
MSAGSETSAGLTVNSVYGDATVTGAYDTVKAAVMAHAAPEIRSTSDHTLKGM